MITPAPISYWEPSSPWMMTVARIQPESAMCAKGFDSVKALSPGLHVSSGAHATTVCGKLHVSRPKHITIRTIMDQTIAPALCRGFHSGTNRAENGTRRRFTGMRGQRSAELLYP